MATEAVITFIGTASAQPSTTRNMSSLCLRLDGDLWMFDCGEGTQHQFAQSSAKLSKVTSVFITHNHGDHLFGLPGMLCTLSGSVDPEEGKMMDIYGPGGLRQYLRTALAVSYSYLNFRIRVHELLTPGTSPSCGEEGMKEYEVLGGNLLPEADGLWHLDPPSEQVDTVVAGPLAHTVPSVGYVVTEAQSPGSLNAKVVAPLLMKHKAAFAAQGIKQPMALMKDLKEGKVVDLPDGSQIRPEDVISAPRQGRKFVILGDTSNSDSLLDAAQDCDVVVHEATNAKTLSDTKSFEEVEQSAIEHGHSTPQMAGCFAKRVGSKLLLLNHFSARYKGDQSPESLAVMQEIQALAQASFGSPNVITAYDHLVVPIPKC